jgi:hypothetical protein
MADPALDLWNELLIFFAAVAPLRLNGRDIGICPHCKQGRMVHLEMLPVLNSS